MLVSTLRFLITHNRWLILWLCLFHKKHSRVFIHSWDFFTNTRTEWSLWNCNSLLYGVVKNLSREKVSLPSLVVGGGWQGTQVVQSSLDGLRDGRGRGQDAALRLVAVLVSDVVDDDGDAVVTGVGVRADDSQGLVLWARVLQLSVRLGGDAVLRLETRTKSRFWESTSTGAGGWERISVEEDSFVSRVEAVHLVYKTTGGIYPSSYR